MRADLLLGLQLLDWTLVIGLVQQVSHVLLGLVRLLQLIQQHRFFLFEELGLMLGHVRVIFLEFYTVFVAIF